MENKIIHYAIRIIAVAVIVFLCSWIYIQSRDLRNAESRETELNQRIQSYIAITGNLGKHLQAAWGESERFAGIIEDIQSNLRESEQNRQRFEEANKRLAEYERKAAERNTKSSELIEKITDRIEGLRDNVSAIPEKSED